MTAMTAPLRRNARPGRSEFSHGRGRFAHPDSDYQSQRNLPWEVTEREYGAKRGGFTADMRRQAEFRSDPTNATEDINSLIFAKGNPDLYGPDEPIVTETAVRAPQTYKQPVIRYGVDRQS